VIGKVFPADMKRSVNKSIIIILITKIHYLFSLCPPSLLFRQPLLAFSLPVKPPRPEANHAPPTTGQVKPCKPSRSAGVKIYVLTVRVVLMDIKNNFSPQHRENSCQIIVKIIGNLNIGIKRVQTT